MRFLFITTLSISLISNIAAQRGTDLKHAFTTDLVDLVQGVGSISYEFYDAKKKGIMVNMLANFTYADIPISGLIERRYYLHEAQWSGFIAPYFSYLQTRGTYTPNIENKDGETNKDPESSYKSKSACLGLVIGYNVLSYSGFTGDIEFGYGLPVLLNVDWASEPSESAEDALRSLVPLIFSLNIGYSF